MSKHSWGTPLRSNIYRGRWPSTCQKVTFHIRWFVPVIIFGNFSSLCFKPYFYKNSKICFSSILLFITFGDSLGKNILKSTIIIFSPSFILQVWRSITQVHSSPYFQYSVDFNRTRYYRSSRRRNRLFVNFCKRTEGHHSVWHQSKFLQIGI